MGDIVETRQTELKSRKICRFCLTQIQSELSVIYSRENRMKSAPLPLQVMACVSIEVFSNDSMPGYVCNECRLIFDYCYRFKQMCKKADTALRHYPLTGLWSPPLEHPKLPAEIWRKHKIVQKNLNALQVSKIKEVSPIVDEINVDKDQEDTSIITLNPENDQNTIPKKNPTQQKIQPQQIEVSIEEPDDDVDYTPKKIPVPLDKSTRKTPVIKILNKSAIRILNKEAQQVIEPIMSKPTLQCDDDGNFAIVTQILEQQSPENVEPVEKAVVLETNVFPCPHCDRSFPLRQLLDIHLVNHNRERSFFCDSCDKSFFSKYDLQKHSLTHTGEKPYVCVVCNKGFTRSTLLHRHEKIHIDIPKFICVFCEKPFISQEEMERHTERHRKHRPYVCKICNKGFAFKQGLERHEIIHCSQQPFQCEYCDQSFSTPSKLSRHLTAHAGRRPYPCKLCPKSYLLSHHLTRHMRSHKNGAGSYKCNDCLKSFGSRDDLIYHSAVHAAQTMICPLCKDAFEDIETVTEHIRQHAEGEAYACEFCDLIYMTSDRLDDHTRAVHSLEMVAYYEDNNKIGSNAKTTETKLNKLSENSTKEIDEVIEEFLYEEFPEDSLKSEVNENVIVKDENDWEGDFVNSNQTSNNNTSQGSNDDEVVGDETLELMNIFEIKNNEPPAKIKKIVVKSQETKQIVPTKQTTLRRKLPMKPVHEVSAADSSSLSPTENKKPPQSFSPAKIISLPKPATTPAAKPAVPNTRQPTIKAALNAIPKTVSVKRVETPNKSAVAASPPKPVETEKTARKSSPRVAAKLNASEQTNVTNQTPNTNRRMLRQRGEVTVANKTETKASPIISGQIKKSLPKSPPKVTEKAAAKNAEASLEDNKKIVEMMIGDKKVKVKKITMSKAQVAEMTRDGLIQMKGGTMILKSRTPPTEAKSST